MVMIRFTHVRLTRVVIFLCTASFLVSAALANAQQPNVEDPLPFWNEGPAKKAIIDFVTAVSDKKSPHYVPPSQRIATIDNDGTLWTEHPMYTQLFFTLDRVKALAPQHPEWATKEPFRSVLADDLKGLASSGEKGIMELVLGTQTGMTVQEFRQIVTEWLAKATHPRFHRPFTELVYEPMLEVMAYLRGHGFKTYIVSGGGVEFMRPWTEAVYGIPPEQVIGSSVKTVFETSNGKPVLMRVPHIDFIDDKEGKPVGISKFIGRRPIAAFGNSDGDLQMLQWTAAGQGARLMVLVHHTDAEREYAYDRNTPFGRLDKALDEAHARGWTVVDMKKDWKVIFPFEKQ
jgi:phosphoglycolate phosphatase-like HAD superfamily hydrolase